MVGVPQEVAHAPVSFPINRGTHLRTIHFEPNDSLRQDLHLSLDGCFRLFVSLVSGEVHISDGLIDMVNTFENIAEMPFGIPKRQQQPPAAPEF
jgi:hypothetical protein